MVDCAACALQKLRTTREPGQDVATKNASGPNDFLGRASDTAVKEAGSRQSLALATGASESLPLLAGFPRALGGLEQIGVCQALVLSNQVGSRADWTLRCSALLSIRLHPHFRRLSADRDLGMGSFVF